MEGQIVRGSMPICWFKTEDFCSKWYNDRARENVDDLELELLE